MLHTLLICGDYWHAVAPYELVLKEALAGGPHSLVSWHHPEFFNREALDNFDLIVLCKEGVVPGTHGTPRQMNWMDHEDEAALIEWVKRGGTLFVWHSGVASYDPEGLQRLYGGVFRGHPPIHPFKVQVTDHEHKLAAGLSDFEVVDELYTFEVEQSAEFLVFLEGVSEEHGRQPIAWTHLPGNGLVICYLLGHLAPSLSHPSSKRLMQNIVAMARQKVGAVN